MSVEGFKIHNINGKEYNFDSDLSTEIDNFGKDGKIDKKENEKLQRILTYNEKRNREKLILKNTTKEKLNDLLKISGLLKVIKDKISNILNLNIQDKNKEGYGSIKKQDELLKLYKNKDITIKDINIWKKKGWKSVKVHYESGTSSTRVSDLEDFYNDVYLVKENKKNIKIIETNKKIDSIAPITKEEAKKQIDKSNEINIKKSLREYEKNYNIKIESRNNGSFFITSEKEGFIVMYENFDELQKEIEEEMYSFGIKKIESSGKKEKIIIDNFNKLIKLDNSGFTLFLKDIFTKDIDLKFGNLLRVYKEIKDGGDELKVFQEYAKLQGWYKGNIDGEWGKLSNKAFEDFLSSQGTNIKEFNNWTKEQKGKKKKLDLVISNRIDIKKYEKAFPTIDNVSELLKSINDMKKVQIYFRKKVGEINRKKLDDSEIITIEYNGNKDEVTVGDLKGILKAINFMIKVDNIGVKKGKKGKINYKEIGKAARKHIESNDVKGIEKLVASALSKVGQNEGTRSLRSKINRVMKQLDGRGFNIKNEAWCAAFIRLILVESGYKTAANNMTNAALSALGINWTGYHIGVYVGGGRFVDGNSGRSTDSVTNDSIYRSYRKNGFVGWIMPQDIGNRRKVHFTLPPVVGAIMVFARGKGQLESKKNKARRELGYKGRTKYERTSIKSSIRKNNKRSKSTLDMLSSR